VEVLVGSDASTDRTDEIVLSLKKAYQRLNLVRMHERSGKASVLNSLVSQAKGEIIVLTDANVLFEKSTIYELIKYFKSPNIGLIDSGMQHTGMKKSGISVPEKTYLRGEAALKHGEGLLWGVMMGPFGGCFAMRKKLYTHIPANCLADDFYLCMSVLQKGYSAMSQPDAVVIEDISNDMQDEFKRKVRIATGNFQNLKYFYPVLLHLNALSFAFFSHKVLRWFGPLFLFAIGLLAIPLMTTNLANFWFGILVCLGMTMLFIDVFLRRGNVHLAGARLLTHFITTNVALFVGMIRFLFGVKTGVWDPTRRHQ
jgi:cellulose synthase/poly-beta-1,6-N-acetylglucosamine synthase-like glycosyltransferase